MTQRERNEEDDEKYQWEKKIRHRVMFVFKPLSVVLCFVAVLLT